MNDTGLAVYGDWQFVPSSASDDGAILAFTAGTSGEDFYDPPVLVLRSQWSPSTGDSIDLFVSFPDRHIVGNNAGLVVVEWALRPARIGQSNDPWNVSITNDAIFSRDPLGLAERLASNTESVFSVLFADALDDGFDARFSLAGAKEAIAGVTETAT